jgi:uncharacterized protein YdaU (DUF1376 family)
MHYYSFHVGDYIHDTAHLSNDEDLAFRRLLDLYYTQEKPIPNKTQEVARRIRMGKNIVAVQTVLQEFFIYNEEHDFWFHKRCDETIAAYQQKVERNREVGKLGGRPKSNPRETQVVSKQNPNQEPVTSNQTDTYICPPNGELDLTPIKKLPECDHKAVIELYHQNLPTMRRVEVWNETRAGYLRQRWREVAAELALEKPIESGDVLNWWADFFQSVGKSRFLTGRVNGKDGRAFVADLEWLIKPSNFAKIVEGKYHGNN